MVAAGCGDSGFSSDPGSEERDVRKDNRPMRVFEINPLVGAGALTFGMTREEVLKAWGVGEPDPFNRSDTEIDGFLGNAVQVNYDEAGRVKFIEFARDDDVAAIYNGMDLLRTPAAEVIEKISKQASFNPDDFELGYSYQFPDLELRFWRQAEENRFFTTTGVGRKGYSD
ncbi:MAG: hypothetical protein AAF514_10775 [Verrucomicrobiota bacterium]